MDVYVFEDLFLDQTAIRAILNDMPGMRIAGVGDMVAQAVKDCVRLRPGLIIADSDIHGDRIAGVRFVKEVRHALPHVRILGLTKYHDCIEPLRNAGCNFVADKSLIYNRDAAAKYIQEALSSHLVALGGEYAPPELTEVQGRVLRMICAGLKEPEIIEAMEFHSKKPLVNAKRQLMYIFGAVNLPNLVDRAYRSKYLDPGRED